jgi:signal transduction histidine kinase
MKLSTKIMLGVVVVISVVNVAVFYVIGRRYDALLVQNLTDTARAFYKQIVVVRAWVARHGGVFVPQRAGVEANPFLATPGVRTTQGDSLVMRNPAMVTRQLSELSMEMGERFHFHLTSLRPINPVNAPDDFEREALVTLQSGAKGDLTRYGEFTRLESIGGKRYFRYFAPLYAEESCLSCHGQQGYRVGDVRGGISIVIPTDKVEAARKRNYTFMVLGCLAASTAVCLLIYRFVRGTVIKPIRRLEHAAESIGKGNYETEIPVQTRDEIGDLGRALEKMQRAIRQSTNKQIESEKMFALGQLSAGIAHEIRNPLFAIGNDLDYLKRHVPEDDELLEVYQEMEEGLTRIRRTVNAVLDYSRPHKPEFGHHRIDEVLDRCMVLLGKQFEKENIRIHIDIDKSVPPIEMDVHRMEQVFVNLLTNAREAVNGRKGEISISARRVKRWVEISVRDNGRGIKPSDLKRIFDPFFTRSPNGTGLGLTIVRRIVEQHGGLIDVKSIEGEGTTFVLRLPLAQNVEEIC